MILAHRSAAAAVPVALVLTLAISAAASAQVASLSEPEETAEPGLAEVTPEFADREEALLAYAQCMRDNGVDMDDPTLGEGGRGGFVRLGGPEGGGPDPFDEDFRLAEQACSDLLEASRPQIDPQLQAELLEQQLALAECVRANGYPEYPDPVIGEGGGFRRFGLGVVEELGFDPRSEDFRETMAACRDELGLEAFGPGGGSGGRGPGPGAGQ